MNEKRYDCEIGWEDEGKIKSVSARNITLEEFEEEYGKYSNIVYVALVEVRGE